MARRRFQLREEQEKELIASYVSCKHGPTRSRYQAVRLYGTGYPVQEVMNITSCSRTSLMEWCRTYRRDGIAGLVDKRAGGNRAKLTLAQIEELKGRLHAYAPAQLLGSSAATADGQFWTVSDLRRTVGQWYGVSYRNARSYHRLFDLCGFSYQRVAKAYKSRSASKVAEFEEQLEKNC